MERLGRILTLPANAAEAARGLSLIAKPGFVPQRRAGCQPTVAGAGIFVLRSQMLLGDPALTAYIPSVQKLALPVSRSSLPPAQFARVSADASFASREPLSYIVPPAAGSAVAALPASLANYVVAHSEYSSPLVRSGLISSLVTGDASVTVATPEVDGEVIIAADASR